jgi:voltage-gated potassium channel
VDTIFTLRHFKLAVVAFFAALLCGWLAFWIVLDEGALESLYRATVTISLTGIDTEPGGSGGKIATIVLILAGMAIYAYLAGALFEVIARGVVTGGFAERRRRRMIDRLRDHYIVCGYGRVGRRVAGEFREAGVQYVVMDVDEKAVEVARQAGELFVHGSGTDDGALGACALATARGLVITSDSDVDNLYVTLSARAERPDLLIVARGSTEDAAAKLQRAGADRVVLPYTAAGQEMAKLVLRPQVAAFLDIVTSAAGPDLQLEEIEITASCGQSGKTIRELRVRRDTGALIIAMRRRDGSFDTTPSPDTALQTGDVLIAVGREEELRALEEIFKPRQAVAG